MNWVDIMILVSVLVLGFFGWRNGAIRWAFTLAGAAIGVVLAGQLYTSVATVFTPVTDDEGIRQVLGFGLVVLIGLASGWFLGRLINQMLNVFLLGWIDNLAGLVLGVAGGAIAATAIISVMGIVPVESLKDAVQESAMAEVLVEKLGFVRALLPQEFDSVTDLLNSLVNSPLVDRFRK